MNQRYIITLLILLHLNFIFSMKRDLAFSSNSNQWDQIQDMDEQVKSISKKSNESHHITPHNLQKKKKTITNFYKS